MTFTLSGFFWFLLLQDADYEGEGIFCRGLLPEDVTLLGKGLVSQKTFVRF